MPSATFRNTLMLLLGLSNIVHGHESRGNKIWRREAEGKLAKRLVPATIEPRATFYGGWSLNMSPCPKDFNDGCCPKGTFPHSVQLQGLPRGLACCPDEEVSCGQAVAAMPICADTSWRLWVNEGQYPFCCLEGDIGYETPGGIWGAGSLCSPGDVPVPESIIASSMVLSTASITYTGSAATSTSEVNTNTNSNDNTVSVGSGSSSSSSNSANNSANNSTTSNNTSGGGMPTGAIAGIAVGAVVVLVLLAIIAFLLKKRKNGTGASSYSDPEPKPTVPPEYSENQVKPNPNYYPPVAEADGTVAQPRPHHTYYPPVAEAGGNMVSDRGNYRGELSG